jgi:hypothetical protein
MHDITHFERTLLREEAVAEQVQREIVRDDIERMSADTLTWYTNEVVRQKQQILEWLSPCDFPVKFRNLVEHRVPDTWQWLLETTEFQQWENGNSPTVLWYKGEGRSPIYPYDLLNP